MNSRGGMTLVELLIVVVIAVLLAAVAIPLVQPAMQNRRAREATRGLSAFIAGAKARAAERNRPAGIWLERSPNFRNQCLQVFGAELPLTYIGDTANAVADVRFGRFPEIQAANTSIYSSSWFWRVYFDDPTTASDDGTASLLTGTLNLIKRDEYFFVQFAHNERRYPVVRRLTTAGTGPASDAFVIEDMPNDSDPLGDPPLGCWDSGPDAAWGLAGVNEDSSGGMSPPPFPSGYTAANGFPDRTNDLREAGNHWPGPPYSDDIRLGLPFNVNRRPVKNTSSPLVLPNGIEIDLQFSGVGLGGKGFDAYPANPPLPTVGGLAATNAPVVITFLPNGQLDGVYLGEQGVGSYISAPVHLLVGHNDRSSHISAPATPLFPAVPTNLVTNLPDAGYVMNHAQIVHWISIFRGNGTLATSNLADASSYWVSINPNSGHVTVAENVDLDVTQDPNYDPAASHSLAEVIAYARRLAGTAQSKGGG